MERWLDEQEELDEKHERKLQKLEKRAAHKGLADAVCMYCDMYIHVATLLTIISSFSLRFSSLLLVPHSGLAVSHNQIYSLITSSRTPVHYHI